MADAADVYEDTKRSIETLIRSLPDDELERPVPATPGWNVKDIASHLTGDIACLLASDFPAEFFLAFGEPDAIVTLNDWTAGQVAERRDMSIGEIFDEWEILTKEMYPMMRGEQPWPDGIPSIADRVMLTDCGVHLHDLYGAFDIQADRDGAVVRMGGAGYIAMMDARLKNLQSGMVRFDTGDKTREAGAGEPVATVHSNKWELFRALSGRRNPDQVRSYDWDGDPEPFISYFYPYGVREEALVE